MRFRTLAPLILAVMGCNKDHRSEPFPDDWPTATYANGHHLVENPGYSRPEDAKEVDLYNLYNQYRIDNGLWAVPRNLALDGLARGHAQHMSEHLFYGHVNPEGLGPTDRVLIIAPHTPAVVTENACIINVTDSAKVALDSFIASPPHHDALLFPADLVGIGFWRGPHPLAPQTGDAIVVVMLFVDLR